jgi:hypothetical protein
MIEFTMVLYRLENVLLIQLDLFACDEQRAKNYYWASIGNIALLAYKNDYIGLHWFIGEYNTIQSTNCSFGTNIRPF